MPTKFSDAVRRAREAAELSQVQLATKAGVSPATVYRIEAGETAEGPAARKVARALGIADEGHSVSAAARAPIAGQPSTPEHEAMAKLIGSYMAPAGALRSEELYQALIKIASDLDDPSNVFKDLARARTEAPPDAGPEWWFRRYLAAKEAALPKRK